LSGAREDLAVLGRFADVLDGLGVPYAVGGSLASGAWGEPRSTHDVDVAVDLPLETVPALVAALQTDFFVDETSVREAAERRSSFNANHKRLYLKVDVFVAGDGELDRRQLERRIARPLSPDFERTFALTAPEDVVLRKLDWFRQGDQVSERQWRDVLGVLKTQASRLDTDSLREGARRLGLAEFLERALLESGPGPSAPDRD
jgi:hypothetical protein